MTNGAAERGEGRHDQPCPPLLLNHTILYG